MVLSSLRSQGFFSDKEQAFWLLQTGGWAAYFVLRTLSGLSNGRGTLFILPAVVVTATGFSLTLIMAALYRRIIRMRLAFVWPLTLVLLLIASATFSVLEVWAHATFFEPGWQPEGVEFLGAILLDFSVLGAWTGLYYGINFYLMLSAQSERMLKISAQAHAAQLAMLRYQLNPHFLFNTLNSISTLVLLKQTERANAMLSRLASFLRYSLVGEPTQMVTLAQEVQALKLYLEIERMRFEERLRTRFEIDDGAGEARLPSLLLQPLVENCIKYAVTPLEEGAEIIVSATVSDDSVTISVSDTGPGLGEAQARSVGSAGGVGLANTRDRLVQAFGSEHRFELRPNIPQGLVIMIEIPFSPASQTLREAAQ